jgi:hypothetical protein
MGMPVDEDIRFIDGKIWLMGRQCHVEYVATGFNTNRSLRLREWCEPSPRARSPWAPNAADRLFGTRSLPSKTPELLRQIAWAWKPTEGSEGITKVSERNDEYQFGQDLPWTAYEWPRAEWAFMVDKLVGCPIAPVAVKKSVPSVA